MGLNIPTGAHAKLQHQRAGSGLSMNRALLLLLEIGMGVVEAQYDSSLVAAMAAMRDENITADVLT